MTCEDRCGYGWNGSNERVDGSAAAAPQEADLRRSGDRRSESRAPFLFPLRQRTARTANPRHAKNCRLKRFSVRGRAAEQAMEAQLSGGV